MSSSKIVPLPPGPQFNPPGEHHPEGFETFKEKPLLLILRLRLICSSKEWEEESAGKVQGFVFSQNFSALTTTHLDIWKFL